MRHRCPNHSDKIPLQAGGSPEQVATRDAAGTLLIGCDVNSIPQGFFMSAEIEAPTDLDTQNLVESDF